MIKRTTYKLALVLLVVFATEGGLKRAAPGAMEATSAIENSAAREIDSPAGAGSSEPNLSVGPDGRVYLSWFEPVQPKGLKAAKDSMDKYVYLCSNPTRGYEIERMGETILIRDMTEVLTSMRRHTLRQTGGET
jgi:hypothetical protein